MATASGSFASHTIQMQIIARTSTGMANRFAFFSRARFCSSFSIAGLRRLPAARRRKMVLLRLFVQARGQTPQRIRNAALVCDV